MVGVLPGPKCMWTKRCLTSRAVLWADFLHWWEVLNLCYLSSPSFPSPLHVRLSNTWSVTSAMKNRIFNPFNVHLHVDIHIWRGFVEVGIHAHPWAGHFSSPGVAWDTSGPQIWCCLLVMKRPHSNSIHESQEERTINDDLSWRGRVIISRSHNTRARKFHLNHLFCGFQKAMCLLVN